MVRWKVLLFAGIENARQAPPEKWIAVAAIVALMLVVGAYTLLS
ncbi:MAG TPA: hypothetical protein VM492_13570 [Sumerlaeia bacterium]|nr:hypothetical protein [Sumerlaeia bacterium]